jgi:ppGpp synthetase/RelA/SpoT-type nucleotidyltranferase
MLSLPDKTTVHSRYNEVLPLLDAIVKATTLKVKEAISLSSSPTYKARVKDFSGYYRKLLKVKPQEAAADTSLPLLTDLLGVRVVCVFLEDLDEVVRQLSKVFQVVEIERKGVAQKVSEFGYESIHVLIKIPNEICASIPATPVLDTAGLVCEIQVRTILQDAWAEVEHELIYKAEFSPFDLPLRRKLASVNASLNLADIIFQEIRDYQNKLNRELEYRRQNFYGKTDDSTHAMLTGGDAANSAAEAPLPLPAANPFLRGTIDDLLLEALQAHNVADYQKAIAIYTKIIQFDPQPNDIVLSTIHKHRGMAFFSQAMYDDAVKDFESSIAFDPNNSRSLYYCGIVQSLLGNHQQAVGYFEKSLAINPFQAHVHYREALAKYNLGEYPDALLELDQAQKLGIDDDDVKLLRVRLVEKFDMSG